MLPLDDCQHTIDGTLINVLARIPTTYQLRRAKVGKGTTKWPMLHLPEWQHFTNVTTQDWISSHLQPNDNQMHHLFHHVYPDLNQVLNVCRLTSWQKYAVLWQGVTSIVDVRMLGATMETIHDNFKHFNSLTKARGSTNFGAIHYTCIHALMEYIRDRQCWHGQLPDPAGFTNAVINEYIKRSGINKQAGDKLEVAKPPKLGENNFHQWEDAILAQLHAKKGNNNVPLAYVVQKQTPSTVYADNTKRLIYEAIQTRPAWEEDKKTVRNFIIRLLAQTPAKTWIKDHMASQDGSTMIATLHTHFLSLAQVECIIQYARSQHDKAVYRSQAVYTFEHFSTDLQEAFTLLVEYDTEIPQAKQIRLLHEKIMMDKADFNSAAITMLMDGNHVTFADAVAHVSQYVSHFFPASSTFAWHGRGNISAVNVSQIAQEKC